MKEEVLNLGKLLVNELELGSSVDTLSRWMAHYIAEQMQLAESAGDEEKKKQAEEKCFETILKLWKHMCFYNGSVRPFDSFESIFQTLYKLDPDNRETFYFQNEYSRNSDSDLDTVSHYLSLAMSVDEAARICLEFLFKSAAEAAVDDQTKEWIDAALSLEDKSEAALICRILSNYQLDDLEDNHQRTSKYLERRIEQLEKFKLFNDELILIYKEDLQRASTISEHSQLVLDNFGNLKDK